MLVFNYLGHGGYKGLSQEGLLRLENVESWSNKDKLPLIITATCAFCPFDDPNTVSYTHLDVYKRQVYNFTNHFVTFVAF